MKTFIYCLNKEHGMHTFYIKAEGQTYLLFRQTYHKGVDNYFNTGVSVNEAIDHAKARRDHALQKTMTKMPAYIRYIEKIYGIEVLKQTQKRNGRRREALPTLCA